MERKLFSERLKQAIVEINELNSLKVSRLLLAINSAYELGMYSDGFSSKLKTMFDFRVERDDCFISYLSEGKEPEFTVNGKWSRKNRQQGKIGKIVRYIIESYDIWDNCITDRNLEEFVNVFKSNILSGSFRFKLVSGKDIGYWYNAENYAINTGTLGSSCMRYEHCSDYFKIYEKCDACEMLIMFDKNISDFKIVGRALVWTVNGKKYVDRRYYAYDHYNSAIIKYIESNKWAYKEINTFDDDLARSFMVYDDGEYVSDDVDLSVRVEDIESRFPYLDTLKYLNIETKILSNVADTGYHIYKLCSPDGDYETTKYCECCGDALTDDGMYVEGYGDCCGYCAVMGINEDYILASEAREVMIDFRRQEYIHASELDTQAILVHGEYRLVPNNHYDVYTDNGLYIFESEEIKQMTEEELSDFEDLYEHVEGNIYYYLNF